MKIKLPQNNSSGVTNTRDKSFPISYGMKVLSIGTDRKLFEGGSAVLLRSLDIACKMEELHIIVFSLRKHDLSSKKIKNLYIYPTNSNSRTGYISDALKIAKNVVLNSDFLRGQSVISTQDPFETGLVGYRLKKRFNLPLQIQIHTDFLSPYFKNSFLNRIRVILAKFLIPKADGLRVVSSFIGDSIKKLSPALKTQPDILPVFIDIENILKDNSEYVIDFPQFDFTVLMASRLTKEKRIDVALDAIKKVTKQFPKSGLIIYGNGPEKNNLEVKVSSLGLTKNVVFIGWREDLVSLYKTFDIFLLTSEYEGYGMTLIEAGASGCPIVTTDVGLAKTDLFKDGQNSFVCPVGDVDCLSKKIILLLSDKSKRQLFKQRMQDSIKSMALSKEEYTANYIGLLEKLLKNV